MLALVVDDETDQRALLRRALERDGFTVLEAQDGAEAFAILSSNEPHLIVLDLLMPNVDGLEFLRRRSAARLAPKAHVVVLSAAPLDDVPADCFAVAKPLSARMLQRIFTIVRDLPPDEESFAEERPVVPLA